MSTTAELLAEARAAHHQLMVGGLPVEIRDSNGESVRYTAANASRLLAYIKTLEAELAGTAAAARQPLRPVWG